LQLFILSSRGADFSPAGAEGGLFLSGGSRPRKAAGAGCGLKVGEVAMSRVNKAMLGVLSLSLISVSGCQHLVPHDTSSLLFPGLHRSEVFGILAGFGTTFAAVPDLVAMLRRRSTAGMNPRMAAIMGIFQILWVYYGLLIASRPVIVWNVVAVLINSLTVGAYFHFLRKEKSANEHAGSDWGKKVTTLSETLPREIKRAGRL
jgi:MtN3 and saliva related transmembrane protein